MLGGRLFIIASLLCCATPAVSADVITHIPTKDKVVALTFDACEAGEKMAFDHGVLDYLLAREIPFTVFASGKFVQTNALDVEALSMLDFVDIENHSWSHPNTMDRYEPERVVHQVERANQEILDVTGRAPQFFRFPAGNYNSRGLKAVENMGYKVVHWRWATGDPEAHANADTLFNRVMKNVAAGDILIFHINGRGYHTAEALPRIVEQLEADGYRFVLISDYIGRPHPRTPPGHGVIVSARRQFDDWRSRAALGVILHAVN